MFLTVQCDQYSSLYCCSKYLVVCNTNPLKIILILIERGGAQGANSEGRIIIIRLLRSASKYSPLLTPHSQWKAAMFMFVPRLAGVAAVRMTVRYYRESNWIY